MIKNMYVYLQNVVVITRYENLEESILDKLNSVY